MTESDPAPPATPTDSDWRDALQKGLGRAALWAELHLGPPADILRHAVLTDLRYDRQCETGRGPWLWGVMQACGATEALRGDILTATATIGDGFAAVQLCQFCVEYARPGDARFAERLRQIVADKPDPSCPWLGEEQLIELDGEAGFLAAVESRGRRLIEGDWDDGDLVRSAGNRLGPARVAELLDAATTPAAVRYRENLRERETARPARSEPAPGPTLEDIVFEAWAPGGGSYYRTRSWGRRASEADLLVLMDCLFGTTDPEVLAAYLAVFAGREPPRFDARLLAFAGHDDEAVRERAFTALAQAAHPDIRAFALGELARGNAEAVSLFVKNFRPGDEELLASVAFPADADGRHDLVLGLTNVMEAHPEGEWGPLAVRAYAATPCALCRHSAAKLAVAYGAPGWLAEECRRDCDEETRKLAGEIG